MKAKALCILLLLPFFGAARADWTSANAGLASRYLFRGLDQNNGPAVQGGFDWARDNGFYAGAWASNNRSAGGGEFDLYGGYSRPFSLLGLLPARYDLGVTGYLYTADRGDGLGGGSQDFAEPYAGLSVGPASLKINLAPDYAGRGAPGWYAQGAVKYPLPIGEGFSLRATLGWAGGPGVQRQYAFLTVDGAGHNAFDYALRLSKTLPWSLTAWAEVAGTSLHLAEHAQGGDGQPKFLAGIRRDFDL